MLRRVMLALLLGLPCGRAAEGAEHAKAAALAQRWCGGPAAVTIVSEATNATGTIDLDLGARTAAPLLVGTCTLAFEPHDEELILRLAGGAAVGHRVTIELPLLAPERLVFTPSERGVMALAANPTYTPAPYAHYGWGSGRWYVLPLVTVLDPASDAGLTLALPPDSPIPAFEVAWRDARTLALTIAHLGLGVERTLRVCLFAHGADYRCALGAYAARFPRYFEPGLPRAGHEGSFWYHHIHAHPDFAELAAQNVKYVWMSFWFTHLGEYLPDATEWEPYTYAKWWALHETMSDARIRAFVRAMHAQGLGAYAYFNVTEYGGMGGKTGDAAAAARALREQFADALIKNEKGEAVPTWEGAMAMNPGKDRALYPFLIGQVERHLTRLPELDGFVIDRLDWASGYDYARGDGVTMLGARAATNLARPVAEAVGEVCRLSHAAGKRVVVNQFWRVELLADVDGYCHEYDMVRGIGYVAPFRPAAAWTAAQPYHGDLLAFEAQLKRRLQFAVYPQMIARTFPVSQQAPDPAAAAMLERFAPLFALFQGKRQVLAARCVAASGANDCNLFRDGEGRFVVPLTSRTRFLSRGAQTCEEVEVTVAAEGAGSIAWAHVYAADAAPARALVTRRGETALLRAARHGTSSVILAGAGHEPALRPPIDVAREELERRVSARGSDAFLLPEERAWRSALSIVGTHVGERGTVRVLVNGAPVRVVGDTGGAFALAHTAEDLAARLPEVRLRSGDEGTWFVPERVQLLVRTEAGKILRVAEWWPDLAAETTGAFGEIRLALARRNAEEVALPAVRFAGSDVQRGGAWRGAFGRRAAWIPSVTSDAPAGGFRVRVEGQAFTWPAAKDDARVLETPAGAAGRATCWFANDRLLVSVTPPGPEKYRVTLYVLDCDRNGRALDAVVRTAGGAVLDRRTVEAAATARGIYTSWVASGGLEIALEKTRGFNVVLSGIFIDDAEE